MTTTKKTVQDVFAEFTLADLISLAMDLRDELAEADLAHKKRTERKRLTGTTVEAEILRRLNEEEISSQNTVYGTATRFKQTYYSVSDPVAFNEFVVKQEDTSMLQMKLLKKEVEAYKDEVGDLPPGVSSASEYGLRMSKPKPKK